MASTFIPLEFSGAPLPDLFTLVAQCNPSTPLVQIITEHADAPVDCICFTWAQVIQHAQNAAADIIVRCVDGNDENAKIGTAQPRDPGSPPVVVGVLANNGYELYINILACSLNRWTVCTFALLRI